MVVQTMDDHALEEHRRLKDEFLATHPQSPLPPEAREQFDGLSYYPPDAALVFQVHAHPLEPEPVTIGTTTGEMRTYSRVATATVDVGGEEITLGLFSTGHHGLFLPFRDATSGNETYGAGRYLDLDVADDGAITIDFNYAYAPFCAYNDAYSCALPPPENWIDAPIEAGERLALGGR